MKFFLNCIKRHCQESEAELNSFPWRLSSFDEMPLVFSAVFGLIMIIAIVIRSCRNCLALFTRICAYYAYAQVATICAGILPLYPFRLPAWRTTNTPTRLPSHVTATATASHATPRHAHLPAPRPAQLIQSSWQRVGARAFK